MWRGLTEYRPLSADNEIIRHSIFWGVHTEKSELAYSGSIANYPEVSRTIPKRYRFLNNACFEHDQYA